MYYIDFISVTKCTLIAQVLEFLPELLDTLKDDGHSLTESEVALFLPCLVEKVYIYQLWIIVSPVDVIILMNLSGVWVEFIKFLVWVP